MLSTNNFLSVISINEVNNEFLFHNLAVLVLISPLCLQTFKATFGLTYILCYSVMAVLYTLLQHSELLRWDRGSREGQEVRSGGANL